MFRELLRTDLVTSFVPCDPLCPLRRQRLCYETIDVGAIDLSVAFARNVLSCLFQVALLQGGNTQMVYERDFMFCDLVDDCSGEHNV